MTKNKCLKIWAIILTFAIIFSSFFMLTATTKTALANENQTDNAQSITQSQVLELNTETDDENDIFAFVDIVVNYILLHHEDFDNISFLLAEEFFPNYETMDFDYFYDTYILMRLLVDEIIEFYNYQPSDIEEFLENKGIEFYIYVQGYEFYDVLSQIHTEINYELINAGADRTYYALSVSFMSQEFYNYLRDYQRITDINPSNYEDDINKLRIFVFGEMIPDPDGLIINGGTSGDSSDYPLLVEDYPDYGNDEEEEPDPVN